MHVFVRLLCPSVPKWKWDLSPFVRLIHCVCVCVRVRVCASLHRAALVKSPSFSLSLWSQMGNDLVASRGILVPLLIPLQDKWAHTHADVHTYTRTMPETLFPLKINGPSNAANAIAAKFGAPAGTMQRDFHVVSANNWICPQFGSDEARFLPSRTHPPPHRHALPSLCLCFPPLLFFLLFSPYAAFLSLFPSFFSFASHLLSQFFCWHLQDGPPPL